MLNNKQANFSLIGLLGLLFGSALIVSAIVINSTNNSVSNITQILNMSLGSSQNFSYVTSHIGTLAEVFNEDNSDFDRGLRKEYLDWHKNFSSLYFKKIIDKEDSIFTVGARNDNIKGIDVNNKNYAIHLLYCDSYHRYCVLKINGVPTKRLYSFKDFQDTKINSFDFDKVYRIKINSVEFDFCDNRRFCHLGYEGYHVGNVSIEMGR